MAFYTDYPPFEEKGGAEIRIERLAEMIVERGHEVSVFCGGGESKRVTKNGVKYHIYRNWWENLPVGVRNVVYIVQTFVRFIFFGRKIGEFDVIDAYRPLKSADIQSFAGSAVTGFGASKILKKLILLFLTPIEYISVKCVDSLITVSQAVKKDLIENYGINEENIYVTYSGTDEEFLKAEKIADNPDPPLISAVKGKEALKKMSKLIDGADFEFIKGLKHGEVLERLKQTDIFIHHSRADGLPMSVREAMAVGLPVVATNVGGIPELIDDGENGYLIEIGDYHRLKSLLILLLTDPNLLEETGEQAREKIKDNFTWDKTVDATLEVYGEIQR